MTRTIGTLVSILLCWGCSSDHPSAFAPRNTPAIANDAATDYLIQPATVVDPDTVYLIQAADVVGDDDGTVVNTENGLLALEIVDLRGANITLKEE